MAISPQQLAAAQKAEDDANAALAAAEAQQQQVLSDPRTSVLEGPKAEAAVAAAVRNATAARRDNDRLMRQAQTEGKPMSEAEKNAMAIGANRAKNEREGKGYLTDKEVGDAAARAAAAASRQNPVPNPAQQQNANTAAARAAETANNNAIDNETARINQQRQFLQQAGLLTQNIGQQVSDEAEARAKQQLDSVQSVVTTGKTLLENETTLRGQDIAIQQARSKFIGDVLNTALPQVAQMMMKLPKGSKGAANFLKAFLVMANMAYTRSGLDKDIPRPDMNSPEFMNMRKWAGMKLPDKIPEMPSADQISFVTAKRMASWGIPPMGWIGPIGAAALDLPDAPATIRAVGGRVPDAQLRTEVENSPEGKAITGPAEAVIKPLLDKKAAGTALSAEEQALVDKTVADTQAALTARMTEVRTQRQTEQTAMSDPRYQFKQEIRTELMGENTDSKLKLMASAVAGQANRLQGKPLTGDQQILLDNLDPEDLAVIQETMTPDIAAILQKNASGQPVTDMERRLVASRLTNASTKMRQRAVTPPTTVAPTDTSGTAPTAPTQPPVPIFGPKPVSNAGEQGMIASDPAAMARTSAESAATKAKRDAELNALTPDERAEYDAISAERKQFHTENPGAMVNYGPDSNNITEAKERARKKRMTSGGVPSAVTVPKSSIPDFGRMFGTTYKEPENSMSSKVVTQPSMTREQALLDDRPFMPQPEERPIPIFSPAMFNMPEDEEEEEENLFARARPSSLFTPNFMGGIR